MPTLHYCNVPEFVESIAVVCVRGDWFHIDENGTPIYQEVFDNAYAFSEGFAVVQKSAAEFHIDRFGIQAYTYRFESVSDIRNGEAYGTLDGKRYMIKKTGTVLTVRSCK